MTKVQLKGVRKNFDGFTAVDGLDLEIGSGELVALLGPSGCGKTTTLRLIAGLEEPTAGAILFDGEDITEKPARERGVGLVPQRFALFPHMTVERNVAFGLSIRKLPKSEIDAQVSELLQVVQLDAFRHRFPAQLSGGQMQRVAIARTLATRPSVLMMDEPLASLDANLRLEMRRFIRDLQQRFAITTVFVTHDQAEAMELADRVAVLLNGRVAQFEAPDVVYWCPANAEVARFVGVSNILPGKLRADGAVESALGVLQVGGGRSSTSGGTLDIALRAEALDILDGPDTRGRQAIPGKILSRQFSGANVSYRVASGDTCIEVSEQSRRLLEPGLNVWLSVDPERIWLIPK